MHPGGVAWWCLRSPDYSAAIANVLQQDRAFSDQAHQMTGAGTPPKQALHWMIDHMAAIDLSSCPPDFAEAYVRHIGAWRAAANVLDQQPDSFLAGLLDGFVNGLSGEADGGVSRERRDVQEASNNVDSTWTDVEAVATRYHVKPPPP